MSLREDVARAMRHRDKAVCENGTYEEYADAAIAIVLERAAGVALRRAKVWSSFEHKGQGCAESLQEECEDIHYAIRQLAEDTA